MQEPSCVVSIELWEILKNEGSYTMGELQPTRRIKHQEFIEAISLLGDSITKLEHLGHRVMQGSAPEVAKTSSDVAENLSLGQFLDAYPNHIRSMTERCEILHNELEGTLF